MVKLKHSRIRTPHTWCSLGKGSLLKLKHLKTESGRHELHMFFWKWDITPEAKKHEFQTVPNLLSVWSIVPLPAYM